MRALARPRLGSSDAKASPKGYACPSPVARPQIDIRSVRMPSLETTCATICGRLPCAEAARSMMPGNTRVPHPQAPPVLRWRPGPSPEATAFMRRPRPAAPAARPPGP